MKSLVRVCICGLGLLLSFAVGGAEALPLPGGLVASGSSGSGKTSLVVRQGPSLDIGFHHLYNLEFSLASEEFRRWQSAFPEDPMGPVGEAAGLLFAEFHRIGLLEGQLLESDEWIRSKDRFTADEHVHEQMEALLVRADASANKRLTVDGNDKNALFALTLSNGLRADWAGLVAKQNFTALRYTRASTVYGQKLLTLDPHYDDAYLATGFAKYMTGSLIAPMRWLLRLGGIDADKQGGFNDLQKTASGGRYLAPFAKILLAIAYVREKNKSEATHLLEGLKKDFPANPLFGTALNRIAQQQR